MPTMPPSSSTSTRLLLAITSSLYISNPDPGLAQNTRPNILFVAVDDLRPELGCYGASWVKSPNIDQLATEGRRFQRAYCQQAICSPSRASLMTGARPDTIRVVENTAYFRKLNPDIITLPQHLRAHGYETVYSGKIFHGNMTDEELSWSRPLNRKGLKRPNLIGGQANPENQAIFKANRDRLLAELGPERSGGMIHGPAFEAGDTDDEGYPDGFNTSAAIQTLQELVKARKPWFLGLGFIRPHLPFHAPKKYFDLYDPASIQLASITTPPRDGAAMGLHASFELRTRHGIPKSGPIEEDLSRQLLHAYYACVSYIDAQLGRMIDALEKAGVRDNTIIVLWGDHGWHLGDYGIWGKATNYEIATRVPFIIWTPDMPARGQASNALVELMDIYPTLCELAGVPAPGHLQGTSLVPLLKDPDQTGKGYALSQFPNPALREWAANPLSEGMRSTFFGPLIRDVENRIVQQQGDRWNRELFENHLMGYSLRTDRYRYIEWRDTRTPDGAPVFTELYDHKDDPMETRNVAASKHQQVTQMSRQLHQIRTTQ